MAKFINMPKLGMTMEEGTVTSWLKQEGDAVKRGEAVFELESDKLANSAEAPIDGILRKILVPVGETVPILAHVGIIAGAEEDISALLAEAGGEAAPIEEAAAPAEAPVAAAAPAKKTDGRITATPRAKRIAKELGVDLADVKTSTGWHGMIREQDVRDCKAAMDAAPTVKASPLARKAAEALGVDLADLKKDGRVLAADLLAYLEKEGGAPAASEERRPMNGMRKAIARNMQASHMTSPTVTYQISVEMDAMRDYRAQLAANGLKVSYTDLLVKFVAKALTEFPLLNCSIEGEELILKHYVNMGVAVALEGGLVVPNIPNADKKGLAQISEELKALSEAARSGQLSGDKLTGGTFTITNLGMYGIESFSPIINQPEVAILGVNAMEEKLVIRKGEQVIRLMMTLSLTADHRAVDGAVAAQFLHRVKTLLENPALMLA